MEVKQVFQQEGKILMRCRRCGREMETVAKIEPEEFDEEIIETETG